MSQQPDNSNLILDVNDVSKVFCRNLKRAMRYGLHDLGKELIGRGADRAEGKLRPGEFYSVRNASFKIEPGECVALIGPNGAGKSTMLKMINGLIKPDKGEIKIRGKIGALIELGTGFNPILSGRENIYINAAVLGMTKRDVDEVFDEIVDFAELHHVIDAPVKTYSSGMRIRLGFSVAANLRPQLLLIDEVLAVGDVGFRMKCFKHLRTLVASGVSIILVTHAVGMLQRVATRAVVFNRGRIVHDGDLDAGCAVYEEILGASERVRTERLQKESRDAEIAEVTVLDSKGNENTEFQTGDSLAVRIRLKSKKLIKNARVIVALNSPSVGVVASMSTAYQEVRFDVDPQLHPDGRVITLAFKDLQLLLGAYHFNISLFGPETTEFFHRRSGCGNFRIVGPPIDMYGMGIHGIMKIDHDWELE
ncbi:ABC transporter ATP-binding protein [Mariniblastus fucicola]|uniref:Teichoic acids export ATP-binding protein TagH n=2 Tax=Mariniblastus fucicola TaxID=980251 RepID=A0A5B9PF34_9BACT|nr:ABC transporter ATP-binding protein [Mariniblastus fucicola]QEG21513.1 Teichoic acids export ATP-binding protein TagH [Mariniblastus fucicola]